MWQLRRGNLSPTIKPPALKMFPAIAFLHSFNNKRCLNGSLKVTRRLSGTVMLNE